VAAPSTESLLGSFKDLLSDAFSEVIFRVTAFSLNVPTLSRHSVFAKGVLLDEHNVILSTHDVFKRITDWSFEEVRLYRPGDPRALASQTSINVPVESIAELQAQDVIRIRFGDWIFFTASLVHDEPELLVLEGYLVNVEQPDAATEVAWITVS
jgi:hypothetical protein